MKYTLELPKDWQALQEDVAKFLKEMEFSSETPFMCTNENISFEIDVFAKKELNGIPIQILIECKYWKFEVPQDVVFSMLTRVSKFGANLGIIISKKGFQKGAISSVKNTNILLYSYSDFINRFHEEWLDIRLKAVFKRLEFFSGTKWEYFLDKEELKGSSSSFLHNFGYLYNIYGNMCSANCTNHRNYSDDGFLNLIPFSVIFPDNSIYKVDVLGDAFRLLIDTDYLEQVRRIIYR